jgi:hypothetical protein
MKYLNKFNENVESTSNKLGELDRFQYFWVQPKDGGKPIISEREINHENGKDYIYWNFIGSDEFIKESEFVKYFDIIKEIEQV